MGNVWLKIKIWTKAILIGALLLYVLLFVYNNSSQTTVWFWFKHTFQSSTLVLIAVAFIAGMVTTVLIGTTLRTLRQVKDLRDRSRIERLERETADMRAKAGRLQTKRTIASSIESDTAGLPTDPPESAGDDDRL